MVHVHMRMRACENRPMLGTFFTHFLLCCVFFGGGAQGLLLNVAFTHLARLESQQASHLCLPSARSPGTTATPAFHVGAGDQS